MDAEKLTSDEALLMAYVAGELEAAELSQFETCLASDPDLNQRAVAARAAFDHAMHALAALDGSYRIDERRSLKQINLLMQQWEREQQVQIPAPISLHHWRPPAWAYAVAAMVLLFVGFCFWWANNSPVNPVVEIPTSEPTQELAVTPPGTSPDNTAAMADADTEPAPMPLAFEDVSNDNSDRISSLEKDIVALSDDRSSTNNMSSNSNQ